MYADIVLHHLDDIGREALVRRKLDKLPFGLNALYDQLLSEAYVSKSSEYQGAYKTFYTWLAYSKRPLEVAEIGSILELSWKEGAFRVEDELEGNAAR